MENLNEIGVILVMIILGLFALIDEVCRLINFKIDHKGVTDSFWFLYIILIMVHGFFWLGLILQVINMMHIYFKEKWNIFYIDKLDAFICSLIISYTLFHYCKYFAYLIFRLIFEM